MRVGIAAGMPRLINFRIAFTKDRIAFTKDRKDTRWAATGEVGFRPAVVANGVCRARRLPGNVSSSHPEIVERMSDAPGPIEVEGAASSGRYVIANPGGDPAAMYFQRTSEGMVVIDHTEVPAAFRGRGAGTAMVARAVEDARRAGERILPLCPFAAAQFRRHPEWADVLHRETEGAG